MRNILDVLKEPLTFSLQYSYRHRDVLCYYEQQNINRKNKLLLLSAMWSTPFQTLPNATSTNSTGKDCDEMAMFVSSWKIALIQVDWVFWLVGVWEMTAARFFGCWKQFVELKRWTNDVLTALLVHSAPKLSKIPWLTSLINMTSVLNACLKHD